jgi:hypothetical protein
MAWLIVGAVGVVVVGAVAWFWPSIRSWMDARRSARHFRALAQRLGAEVPRDGDALPDAGFLTTVRSVFGLAGELRNVVTDARAVEPAHLFEYRFGARPSAWAFRLSAVCVAFRLEKPPPMFTLRRARGGVAGGTTEHRVDGQPLVVQRLGGGLELWFRRSDRRPARRLVERALVPAVDDDPAWDIRASGRWLVLFHERHIGRGARSADELAELFERARALRSKLVVR